MCAKRCKCVVCVCVSKEARLLSFAFDVLFYNELSVDNELREPDGKREREKERENSAHRTRAVLHARAALILSTFSELRFLQRRRKAE